MVVYEDTASIHLHFNILSVRQKNHLGDSLFGNPINRLFMGLLPAWPPQPSFVKHELDMNQMGGHMATIVFGTIKCHWIQLFFTQCFLSYYSPQFSFICFLWPTLLFLPAWQAASLSRAHFLPFRSSKQERYVILPGIWPTAISEAQLENTGMITNSGLTTAWRFGGWSSGRTVFEEGRDLSGV